jgi:hypothetical protein
MPSNRWLDKTQPQTLMSATLLMYLNAGLFLFSILAYGLPALAYGLPPLPFLLVLVVGPVAAGWGVANEKKWGYWLGVVLTGVVVAFLVLHFSFGTVINLMFYGALLALLLHPQSRAYRRIWFR